ncbi:1-acyl-sn-glycerol-3-phosphate acyltransferase [Williamsia sp. CHRR-6]|uniref:lysophospholipid acyltransferase family protein n=1 Tax=Williamsia sp. CHRR-6 TaxID=2835871 RepID=UPI001BD9BB5F|nr:lysophospholipid acyltransferase family protein [Williamsia sp. CHRR-6]MBT0567598.1 1-acyl-sn-glycerol-3-phosphate acyltransferase [Williamsia sp. CHRR-6]
MEPVYRSLEIAAHALVAVQGTRLTIEGVEKIPSTGGLVVAINHTGYVDFIPAALGAYRAGRRIRYLIKSEMMDVPPVRFLINHTHTVPVDRSAGSQAYAAAVAELRAGYALGVYPEATISRSFELKEFKTGAVRMAQEARVPILPTIVWGAHRQWTKGMPRAMGRAKIPVLVRFGDLMTVPPDADPVRQTAELKSVMGAMLDAVRADYGPHPAGAPWVPAAMGGSAPTPERAHEIEAQEAQLKAELRAERRAAQANSARPWWKRLSPKKRDR